jgi:hypothetical protein
MTFKSLVLDDIMNLRGEKREREREQKDKERRPCTEA